MDSAAFSGLLRERWSPRLFTDEPVDGARLQEIFDAVRWAQSSFNEQPWRYLIAQKADQPLRDKLESCLVEGNAFAKEAAVLGVSLAKTTFTRNGKPNRVAVHDLGAANQLLAMKAFELGLNTRFMAGFDVDEAQRLAPEDFVPVAMFVIGQAAAEALKEGPGDRDRNAIEDFVYCGEWGKPVTP